MAKHSHAHEHELLYVCCGKCGSSAMTVAVMEGAVIFDCADCKAEVGAMENIDEETRKLLSRGCQGH